MNTEEALRHANRLMAEPDCHEISDAVDALRKLKVPETTIAVGLERFIERRKVAR